MFLSIERLQENASRPTITKEAADRESAAVAASPAEEDHSAAADVAFKSCRPGNKHERERWNGFF